MNPEPARPNCAGYGPTGSLRRVDERGTCERAADGDQQEGEEAAGPGHREGSVDARGVASPVVGPEAATRLGYGDTAAPVVPVAWLDLFERGVPLSVEAVLTGVGPAGGP